MPYPFANPDFYGSARNGPAQFRAAPFSAASRVVLVAINGDLLPRIFHDDASLHRMRVTLVPPNEVSEWDSSESLPPTVVRPLPPLPPALGPGGRTRARVVHGEILRDREGRLYEKIADKIRPIDKLFSGPRGEILEVVPPDILERGQRQVEHDGRSGAGDASNFAAEDKEQRQGASQPAVNQQLAGREAQAAPRAQPMPTPYRQLFADLGPKRVVRLADFKAMLTPQLAHPERLRDTHRLACYLQVYETSRAARLEALATSALGDAGLVNQLDFLTEPMIRVLGLTGLPRTRPRIPPEFRREPGIILPNERVFRLRLAHDPTAGDERPAVGAGNPQGQGTVTPAHAQDPGPLASGGLKKSIPEPFVKAWEFKLSREEALYDITVNTAFAGWFASLARRLARRIGFRRELKKWKVFLSGKSPDEQLWAVTPPRGGVSHSPIREWARKTLEAAGYDSQAMLLEWEIFWRRKQG